MAQLCDATGVSERSLRNACHAVCGTSPKRYLTRRRLEAVRQALEIMISAYNGLGLDDLAERSHEVFALNYPDAKPVEREKKWWRFD